MHYDSRGIQVCSWNIYLIVLKNVIMRDMNARFVFHEFLNTDSTQQVISQPLATYHCSNEKYNTHLDKNNLGQ